MSKILGHIADHRLIHMIATRWGQAIFRYVPGWSVQIKGREFLPKENEALVLVANHESAVDILAIYFLGIQFRWLSKDTVFKIPLMGQAMRKAGYISITRGNRDSHRQAMEESAEHLRNGIPMLFFPEGTRSKLGHPTEFKVGAFKLAMECQAPVLPIVLKGAGSLLAKGTLAPNRANLNIHILPPCHIGEDESVLAFTKRVQQLICKAHAAIHESE